MLYKLYETLDKGNSRFNLTVTSDRVTIKLQKDANQKDTIRVILFLTWVSTQPEMEGCTIAFRGRTQISPTDTLLIQMVNDNGKIKHTYRESNMNVDLLNKV